MEATELVKLCGVVPKLGHLKLFRNLILKIAFMQIILVKNSGAQLHTQISYETHKRLPIIPARKKVSCFDKFSAAFL